MKTYKVTVEYANGCKVDPIKVIKTEPRMIRENFSKTIKRDYLIKGEEATQEEYDKFIASLRRPLLGKKVVIDGIEYTLK